MPSVLHLFTQSLQFQTKWMPLSSPCCTGTNKFTADATACTHCRFCDCLDARWPYPRMRTGQTERIETKPNIYRPPLSTLLWMVPSNESPSNALPSNASHSAWNLNNFAPHSTRPPTAQEDYQPSFLCHCHRYSIWIIHGLLLHWCHVLPALPGYCLVASSWSPTVLDPSYLIGYPYLPCHACLIWWIQWLIRLCCIQL